MLALVLVHPVKLTLGHIPAQIQQFTDTGRRLFPRDEGGAGTLGAFALGNTDSLGIVPDGVLAAIQIKASAVLAIVLCQAPGIVRLILFEIGADVYKRQQMAKNQGVTEELKASDQMKWVQMMSNLQNAAEETVLAELIYS